MKKLLYILPIVLLMGFNSVNKGNSVVETDRIVFDFDSTGITLNEMKVTRDWTYDDIEAHLGKPSSITKFMKTANYNELGLGVGYKDESMNDFEGFILFFEFAPEPMQKFKGDVRIFGEKIDFKQSITKLYHQFKDRGMHMDDDKQKCKIYLNGCTIQIAYRNNELDLILLTQN